jgi:hypothetical protein
MVTRTHGPLRRGNGRPDDAAVMHRSHRPPATIPARRGMRASWFRDRGPTETEGPVEPAADPALDAELLAPEPGPATVVTHGIRTAFGHPTF